MGSSAENGSPNVRSRDWFHPNVRTWARSSTGLNGIYRTLFVGVIGALWSCLPHSLPLEVHIKYVVTCSAIRLREFEHPIVKPYRKILDGVPRQLCAFLTDSNFTRNFAVYFPTRVKCRTQYSSTTKMNCGGAAGVLTDTQSVAESNSLSGFATVFLAVLKAYHSHSDRQ